MTAEEAVNYGLNKHPMLYASATLTEARANIFGQLFNTIGNGYSDHAEFAEAHQWTPKIAEMTRVFPTKYIGKEALYIGYLATKTAGSGAHTFAIADSHSSLHGLYTEAEKEFHPDVQKWTSIRRNRSHTPYPNFKKEYSLLYQINIEKLDDSWLKAGIEYYTYCREFFNGNQACKYHGAWPANTQDQDALVADYTTSLARCIKGITEQQTQWDTISKAYGTPYKGDTALFIQERWAKEKTRIEAFIGNTVGMLDQQLVSRQHATPMIAP